MDVLAQLIMGASIKKATMLEQWLYQHRGDEHSATLAFSNDATHVQGICSCGELLELTVVIDVNMKIAKCQPA